MTAAQTIAKYGEYHRDRRNVLTHALGIPMIVLALEVLLARPVWPLAGFALTPPWWRVRWRRCGICGST